MESKRVLGPVLLFAIAFIFSIGISAQLDRGAKVRGDLSERPARYKSDEILVKFRSAATARARTQVHAAVAANTVRRFGLVKNLELVRLPASVTVEAALRKYRRDPAVEYAEPNYVRKSFDSPNDPLFIQQWSLHNTGQSSGIAGVDIHALEAWALSTGSKQVVVAITDTGVDYTHEDLAANMWQNTADCNHNGVDDDGNGYIDDCYGINTVYNSSDPMDDYNHGTHVAGIIGAAGNNGIGISGVNWNVSIMACKFLDDWGYGTDAGAIGCLEYIAKMKDRGVNIIASNNSWGGGGYSRALYEAIDQHRQRGILFMAAAGNWAESNDALFPNYPSSYGLSNIVAVAATTNKAELAYFSSYGRRTVHVGAPGDKILSTVRHNRYRVFSGTSMATPHVTGVAALLAAQDPTRDWKTIRNLLLAGGTVTASLGETVSGRSLNALGSMTCSNSTVNAALLPAVSKMNASSGSPVTFSALNINCGAAAGPVTVTIAPSGEQVLLADSGQMPDQDAGDGIYTGHWIPSAAGTYTYTFPDGQSGTIVVDPYSFSSATYSYRDITGAGLALDDDSISCVESPFPVSYAGSAYAYLCISDNGTITFDGSWTGANKPLPYVWSETLVAPFWDDLLPVGLKGNVFWQVNGTPPNRELVIEWRNLSNVSCSAEERVKFQTVFFENSPDVLFNYADVTFGGNCADHNAGAQATIGVQFDHTAATQYSFDTACVQEQTALLASARLPDNPVPAITSLSPNSYSISTEPTWFQVKGVNLLPGSVVLWNGRPRRTYYLSDGSVYAYLDYGDLSAKGTAQVSVFNALPGGGASNALAFTITDPDFMLLTDMTSLTAKSGQVAQFYVWTAGKPAWDGLVSLTCATSASNATCAFSPTEIEADEYAQLTVSVGPKPSAVRTSAPSAAVLGWQFALVPAGLVLLAGGDRRRRWKLMLATAIIVLVVQVGCGGGGSSPTCPVCPPPPVQPPAPASYTITLTGTSGSLQHSTTVTVVVLP